MYMMQFAVYFLGVNIEKILLDVQDGEV